VDLFINKTAAQVGLLYVSCCSIKERHGTYHTNACSQKIFCVNDIFPYGEGLPVLNCNSQAKARRVSQKQCPKEAAASPSLKQAAARILQPSFDILAQVISGVGGGRISVIHYLVVVILEDNTRLHISTRWSASLLMRGGSATSFPSYFSLPRKGACKVLG